MAMFGRNYRDFATIRGINRELLGDVIEQKVGVYKPAVNNMDTNIYGENLNKTWEEPVLMNCLVNRNPQTHQIDEYGVDINREMRFAFLRDDLVDANLFIIKGDVILWEGEFYLIDAIEENQLFVGKNDTYPYRENIDRFGRSVSIVCIGHMTRRDNLGIEITR